VLPLLMWVPVAASLVLGLVYLVTGEGGPGLKVGIGVVFLAAVILQVRSSYPLAGLLLQAGLALALALWWKLETSE